mgnify:CR=1 FL=1|jgi:hypothetical protein
MLNNHLYAVKYYYYGLNTSASKSVFSFTAINDA